jgi:hypothetical protein
MKGAVSTQIPHTRIPPATILNGILVIHLRDILLKTSFLPAVLFCLYIFGEHLFDLFCWVINYFPFLRLRPSIAATLCSRKDPAPGRMPAATAESPAVAMSCEKSTPSVLFPVDSLLIFTILSRQQFLGQRGCWSRPSIGTYAGGQTDK